MYSRTVYSRSRRILSVCVGILAMASAPAFAGPVALQKPAPEFVRTDLENRRVDLHALRGRVVLLNFWATWCGPCKLEIPQFVAWQSKYGERGLKIIGVAMDEDADTVRRSSTKLRIDYPVVLGDNAFKRSYGDVSDLPRTFLIGPDGKVAAIVSGEADLNALEKQLVHLLNH